MYIPNHFTLRKRDDFLYDYHKESARPKYTKDPLITPCHGVFHKYFEELTAFEHTPMDTGSSLGTGSLADRSSEDRSSPRRSSPHRSFPDTNSSPDTSSSSAMRLSPDTRSSSDTRSSPDTTSSYARMPSGNNSFPNIKKNTILFLGGHCKSLLNPSYPALLASLLPPSWRLVEVLTTSSSTAWPNGHLARDAYEVGRAVTYFHQLHEKNASCKRAERGENKPTKIVLLGHSTGAQVCMEYITARYESPDVDIFRPRRPRVDGIILQAGFSDREALATKLSSAQIAFVTGFVRAKYSQQDVYTNGVVLRDVVLPSQVFNDRTGKVVDLEPVFGAMPTTHRWMRIVQNGADKSDYFSSDLSDFEMSKGIGKVADTAVPLLVLLSGEDEFMPESVDKEALLKRWEAVVRSSKFGKWDSGSCVLEGANHALNKKHGVETDEIVVDVLSKKVNAFLGKFKSCAEQNQRDGGNEAFIEEQAEAGQSQNDGGNEAVSEEEAEDVNCDVGEG